MNRQTQLIFPSRISAVNNLAETTHSLVHECCESFHGVAFILHDKAGRIPPDLYTESYTYILKGYI